MNEISLGVGDITKNKSERGASFYTFMHNNFFTYFILILFYLFAEGRGES